MVTSYQNVAHWYARTGFMRYNTQNNNESLENNSIIRNTRHETKEKELERSLQEIVRVIQIKTQEK